MVSSSEQDSDVPDIFAICKTFSIMSFGQLIYPEKYNKVTN